MDKGRDEIRKGEKDMGVVKEPTKNEKIVELNPILLKKAPTLPVRNGVVILDPKNPLHRKWMED